MNKRRIVIDARQINSSTGVYMQHLLLQLNSLPNDSVEYVVLVSPKELSSWRKKLSRMTLISSNYTWYSFGEQIGLALQLYKLKPDLVHFCMPQQPLLYFGKRVTTVHDLTLLKYDNVDMNLFIYRLRKAIFKYLLKNVIWRSKAVITPTEFVKNDLIAFAGKRYADKFTVTLEAGDPDDSQPENIAELVDKKYLFFIGNAFPYKNLSKLIEAFYLIKRSHPDLHLALAGKKEFFYEQLERETISKNIPDVHFLGFISDGQKRWAFGHAQAYVTTTLSEGFHIPLLEAMYEDCPVVCSNLSCLPEVAGDAALYFNPHSISDIADKIITLLESQAIREQLITKGKKRVTLFSWQRMAEQTLSVYNEALELRT